MDCGLIVLPKYLYDEWAKGEMCVDFNEEKLYTLEERRALAFEEMIAGVDPENFPDADDVDDFIMDNADEFPQTYEEFLENYDYKFFGHTSKSGDEMIIITYEYY